MIKKKINKLIINKSKYPDEDGNYVLFHYSETNHGCNWRRIFKGSENECLEYKLKLMNVKL